MRNLYLITVFTIASLSASFSQEKVGDMIALAEVPESVALMSQAQKYTNSLISGQFDVVAALTHNDIISMGGGVDFLVFDLKAEATSLEKQGMTYDSVEIGSHPEFLNSDGELQTILPVKFHLLMNSKKVESWVNIFATSSDEGVTWKFVNLEKFDEPSLRAFVKNVSAELVFP